MTEHVQLELIAALILISGQVLTAWRADIASRRAQLAVENAKIAAEKAGDASKHASEAVDIGVRERAIQSGKLDQVHEAVNGNLQILKQETIALKAEVIRLKQVIADRP